MNPLVPRSAVRVVAAGPVSGQLAAPTSKSVTNRLLALAAVADGVSVLREPLASDDADAMRSVVEGLGAPVTADGSTWTVTGSGGRFEPVVDRVDARLSGTTMRFGVALATLAGRPVTVTGGAPLLRRPIGALVAALRELGGDVSDQAGHPPVRCVGGGLSGGRVVVDAARSSQYVSAVLLVAPCARHGAVVSATGLAAEAYVDLTVAAMRDWGAVVDDLGDHTWRVAGGTGYAARDRTVEYDASAACHLYGLAMATGGQVTVTNVAEASLQPDAAFPDVLLAMGAEVTREGSQITVEGPRRMAPVEIDLTAMPDQVTTLAALAALAEGTTVIRGVAVARGHETDRLAALATELAKLGVAVEEHADGLTVHGGRPRGPARLATYDDHRLAMAFAALAAAVPDVVVEEPWCVTKTYPSFWEDARALGLSWSEEAGAKAGDG